MRGVGKAFLGAYSGINDRSQELGYLLPTAQCACPGLGPYYSYFVSSLLRANVYSLGCFQRILSVFGFAIIIDWISDGVFGLVYELTLLAMVESW